MQKASRRRPVSRRGSTSTQDPTACSLRTGHCLLIDQYLTGTSIFTDDISKPPIPRIKNVRFSENDEIHLLNCGGISPATKTIPTYESRRYHHFTSDCANRLWLGLGSVFTPTSHITTTHHFPHHYTTPTIATPQHPNVQQQYNLRYILRSRHLQQTIRPTLRHHRLPMHSLGMARFRFLVGSAGFLLPYLLLCRTY